MEGFGQISVLLIKVFIFHFQFFLSISMSSYQNTTDPSKIHEAQIVAGVQKLSTFILRHPSIRSIYEMVSSILTRLIYWKAFILPPMTKNDLS
jgi:hypothetical protein